MSREVNLTERLITSWSSFTQEMTVLRNSIINTWLKPKNSFISSNLNNILIWTKLYYYYNKTTIVNPWDPLLPLIHCLGTTALCHIVSLFNWINAIIKTLSHCHCWSHLLISFHYKKSSCIWHIILSPVTSVSPFKQNSIFADSYDFFFTCSLST